MKKYILFIMFLGILANAHAQDPQVSAPNVTPSPAANGGPITASLNFQNASSVPINNPDPLNNMTVITISLNKMKPNMDVNGIPTVTGAGAVYFDWSASCSGTCATDGSSDATDVWTVSGFQNQVIPGAPDPFTTIGGPIEIPGVVTAPSTPAEANAKNGSGFIANVTPGAGGDIDNSPGSNSVATYTEAPLPVTLTRFNAAKEGNVAQLSWATTEETNSDRFDIQRSADGKKWAVLGSVTSSGESVTLKTYSFTDTAPLNGGNLYRLKMIDKDETFAYSTIRAVQFTGLQNGESVAYVYPNPSSERVFLNTTDIKTAKQAVVLDMNGRSVLTTSAVADGVDIRKLAAGTYVLKVFGADGSSTVHKFVIAR